MKLRVGAALFGLGVLLLVFAAGLPFYVAPAVTKLPYDLEPTTSVAEAKNARFLKITATGSSVSIEVPQGNLVSNVEVIPQPDDTKDRLPEDLKGDAVIWDVYQTVRRTDNQDVVSEYSTELALYRISGGPPVEGPVAQRDRGGRHSGRQREVRRPDLQVPVRHRQARLPDFRPRPEAGRSGEVRRHREDQGHRDVPLRAAIGQRGAGHPGEQHPDAGRQVRARRPSGQIVYSNIRTVWVDPVTGSYVNVREQQHKELRPNTGTPTVLLDADFNYTDDTVSRSVETVKDNRFKIGLISFGARSCRRPRS